MIPPIMLVERSPIALKKQIEDRGLLGILTGWGAESARRWRTNKLGDGGTENRGNFRNRTRQSCSNQYRRGRNRRGVNSDMSGRANRAGVVGGGRVLGMRAGCMDEAHHANEG